MSKNSEDFKEANKRIYLDQKDFMAEFLFNPDISENADYKHLDKNLSTTRLASRFLEPERARAILKALHILSNQKYFVRVEESRLVGYEKEEGIFQECEACGQKHLSPVGDQLKNCSNCKKELPEGFPVAREVPVFKTVKTLKSIYPKTYHKLKSAFYALTTTAAARDGHLIRAAGTTRFEREDTIEDRTEIKSRWGFSPTKQQNSGRKF